MNANRRHRALALVASVMLALAACSTPPSPQPAPAPPAPPAPAQAAPPVDTAAPAMLRVDHAWVRDADTPAQQGEQAATMAALRAKVVAGGAFVASWNALGVDGANWHVAEDETYASDILPEPVRALPVGSVSDVVPGDGGLHLFRILGREPVQ